MSLGKSSRCSQKCLESLPADAYFNNVKSGLRQQFSLVPLVMHAAMQLVQRYEQRGESLYEFNIEFSKLTIAITNLEHKDIADPLKILIYMQVLFNPVISSIPIWHTCLRLQKQ